MDTQFIPWRPVVLLEKFDHDQAAWVSGKTGLLEPNGDTMSKFVKPYETMQFAGNLLTTLGLARLTNLLTGVAAQALTGPTTTRIGVGDDSTAAAVGDTDLSTSTTQYYQVLDATYPQGAGTAVLTLKASFPDVNANFAWNSWGIDVGAATVTSNGTVNTLINRKVQSMGTKTSGIWALTVTLTFS